jgi:hypothetical protein
MSGRRQVRLRIEIGIGTDKHLSNGYNHGMLLFITFILGVANFAMQKAMMESDHPLVSEARRAMRRYMGPHGSYILEFIFLMAAFFFANIGMISGVIGYSIYTMANGAGAWVLRSRK